MKMQSFALMFLCYVFFATRVEGQITAMFRDDYAGFCCNNNTGPTVKSAPASLAEIVDESPIYEQMVTNSFYTQLLDNVCDTFFKLDNSTYLRFTGLTYADGSIVVEKFIVSELPSYVGVFRVQGLAQEWGSSTIVYDEVYIGSACPGVRVYYRNMIAGRCDILTYATMGDIDFVFSESSSSEISDYCKSQITVVAGRQQFCRASFSPLPNKLKKCCVAKLNGVSCINAYKIRPEDTCRLRDLHVRLIITIDECDVQLN